MPRLCVTSAPRPASTAPARAAGAPTVPPPFHSGPGAKGLAGCSVGDGTAAVRGRKGGAAAEWWRAHAQGPHPCGHEPSQWLQPTDEHFSEYVGVNELFWYFSNLRNPIFEYLFRVGGHHVACDEASQVATARSLSRPRACPAPYARPMNARGTCAVGTVPSLSPCPQQSCRARARDPPPRYDTLNSNLKPTFWHCLPPALMPHGPLSAYTHTHTRTHTHTHRCG